MNKSESIAALAAALAKAQAAMQPAAKDSRNPHFNSRYADLAAVWDACRTALTANGLSVVQMPVDAEGGRVALTTVLMHASGEWIASSVSTRVVKDDPQGVGSAITYLRRYSLAAMVGVAPDDDDGNAASGRPNPEPARAATLPQSGAARTAITKAAAELRGQAQSPKTPHEAGKHFFDTYERVVGGRTWRHVQQYLGINAVTPTTIDGWMAVAESVLAEQRQRANVPPEDGAAGAPYTLPPDMAEELAAIR